MSGYWDRHRTDDPPPASQTAGYRLWVNADSTVFVRMWASGTVEIATRDSRDDLWGPPVELDEEKV